MDMQADRGGQGRIMDEIDNHWPGDGMKVNYFE